MESLVKIDRGGTPPLSQRDEKNSKEDLKIVDEKKLSGSGRAQAAKASAVAQKRKSHHRRVISRESLGLNFSDRPSIAIMDELSSGRLRAQTQLDFKVQGNSYKFLKLFGATDVHKAIKMVEKNQFIDALKVLMNTEHGQEAIRVFGENNEDEVSFPFLMAMGRLEEYAEKCKECDYHSANFLKNLRAMINEYNSIIDTFIGERIPGKATVKRPQLQLNIKGSELYQLAQKQLEPLTKDGDDERGRVKLGPWNQLPYILVNNLKNAKKETYELMSGNSGGHAFFHSDEWKELKKDYTKKSKNNG